ncbi:MAG: GTPase Era [Bacteroidales bacterium]|nr:GTPase Era [Bacteroidales bacterium]
MYKAGFVNIIGKPNVGKSSLMNNIIGEKLSIISPKVQTTRHRIKAFYNDNNVQIIFSDTPGLLSPKYKLQECMMDVINEAIEDADILLYLTTIEENPNEHTIPSLLSEIKVPLIIGINKIDLAKTQQQVETLIQQWKHFFPNAIVIPLSSLHHFNTQKLLDTIIEYLPEHEPYFDNESLSDRNIRFFVSEFIREKIFLLYEQEIPYSCEVVIDSFIEEETHTKIYATIYVARESQKAILIGQKGKAIKQLGTEARIAIEDFLDTRIYLDLSVKVLKNWRNDPKWLKRLGYIYK